MTSQTDFPSGYSQEIPAELQEQLVQLFRVLGDRKRLSVVLYLCRRGELHVSELCELLEQSQPAVSHHLSLMREAGLIDRRRDGKHNYYSLRPSPSCDLLKSMIGLLNGEPKPTS